MAACVRDLSTSLESTKSPNDRNSYRLIRLGNGIEALLVSNSDEQKQKSACACSIQVGSFSDPGHCQGLAHYCEHMIFLGSKRYPGEAQFEEFLSENGGESNAYTECEYTCLYFDVNRKALHHALKMFAELLHEPLFTQDASARELQAIESEFQKKRRSDHVRGETLFASFASPGHPWRSFGWGNLQSLDADPKAQGVDLHAELRHFFSRHYKACRMRLSVFGIESLDSLELAVVDAFSIIPPSDVEQLDFEAHGLPLCVKDLPRLVRVRPICDGHVLWLSWQLPSQLKHYKSKPESYLSSLIGDEGHGSILSYLKDMGWATDLCAGAGGDNFSHSRGNSMIFTIEITLTVNGLGHWTEVVATVFQYLDMLRSYPDGDLPSYLYEEKKLMAECSFRFLQEKDPLDPGDLVIDLSERMLPFYRHEADHLLTAPWIYSGFREDLVRSILNLLTVRGCFFMLMSSSHGRAGGLDAVNEDTPQEGEPCREDVAVGQGHVDRHFVELAGCEPKVEPYFGTEYWDSPLEETLLLSWESLHTAEKLHVPPPNPFIATDFSILQQVTAVEEFPQPKTGYASFPAVRRLLPSPELLRSHAAGLKLWHLPCADRFRQPRSQVSVKMHSPYYSLDAGNVQKGALLELYALCFNDSLNEMLYAAGKARLHCAVNSTSYGLTIKAGGFSQKLLRLVETTLCGRKLEKYKPDRFLAMHEALLRSYRNSWLKPQAHCSDLRKLLLMPSMPRPSGKEAQLNSCGSEQLMAFVQNFNTVMGCELLVSGNTPAEELMGWAGTVFDGYRLEPQTKLEVDVVQLPVGSATVWLQSAVDATQSNSAVEIYFQLPERDTWQWQEDRVRVRVLLALLEDVMYESLFDELRTKQQLGYSVGCSMRDTYGVPGFSIYILSAVQMPPILVERAMQFLQDFGQQMRQWQSNKFESHIVALAGRWLEPKRTLGEAHGACWSEISFGFPVFDRSEREVAILGSLKQEELLKLFELHLAPGGSGRACIVTAVVPSADELQLPALCESISKFRLAVSTVQCEGEFHSRSHFYRRRRDGSPFTEAGSFGQTLETYNSNNWPKFQGAWIQYEDLKRAISVYTGQDKDNATVESVTHWSSSFLRLGPNPELPPEARLNDILTAELSRIGKFVQTEEARIHRNLDALKQDVLASKPLEELCRRLEEVGTDISDLKFFVQQNFTGFRKALKKYEKSSKKFIMQWFMTQVAKAPLMATDFDNMLGKFGDIAQILRSKGAAPYSDVKHSLSGADGSSLESTYLLEAKSAMKFRVKLAAFMVPKNIAQDVPAVGAGAKAPRPKTTSVFLDTPDFKVYNDVLQSNQSMPSAAMHIRRSDPNQVACVVYQAKGDKKRTEVLIRSDEVARLLKGQVPSTVLDARAIGVRGVIGSDPPADKLVGTSKMQEVTRTFGNTLVPMAEASYSRSILQDDCGIVVILDEEVRFGKIKEWDSGSPTSVDFFPYVVITVKFPPGLKESSWPRWLGLFEDGSVVQANGFSKGAHAIARFHALGLKLQMPHWYANVYSDLQDNEENEAHTPQEPSEGSLRSGNGRDDDAPHRWTESSARLLHEFGTTPQQEQEMALTRIALAKRGGSPEDAKKVPADDAGKLSAPLLSGSAPAPKVAEQGFMQRLLGADVQTSNDKPTRRAIVAVQPKTLYSNERTFLEWIHFATIIAAAGVLMLHISEEAAHATIGRLLVLAAVFLIAWSVHVFSWRADGLDAKVDMRYEDNLGPVVLVVSIMGALVFSTAHA
ncbi:Nrdc, partial [Symbiodinium sp. KB8]